MAVPITPVSMTITAASEATPPICSATGMAIGMVTNFGARLITTLQSAPSAQPMARVNATDSTPPAVRVISTGQNNWRMRLMLCCSGTARATVAGPSSQATGSAPAR